MAFFSAATLERVRAANDIVDVIGSYLPLKRAGANFTALCPFHKEKTPSFNVNPHLQIFHCFGCHKGGDVFTFVKEYESVDFPEAVRRLADRAKIPLETEARSGEGRARHLKEVLLQIHHDIATRWQNALRTEAGGEQARQYLRQRSVPAEAVELFRLGYAPDLWDDTVNWARSKGHDLELVEKAGLILRKESGGGYYDRFRGRLMFPICDEPGRVIGFSGRVLSGDQKTAKYVNSPETPIFVKSKVFFGLDKTKRAILDAGQAIICEGQLDLIACFMSGVQNIVAPQGTAFTSEHARILKRYADEAILCFDSDTAGQTAAVRAFDSLLASGFAVRVATLPAPHDPDSYIKANGPEAFRKLIGGAEGFFDYLLNRLCGTNDISGDRGRLAVLHGMAEAVQKAGNQVLADTYAQKTALRLGVAPDAVRAEFRKVRPRAYGAQTPIAGAVPRGPGAQGSTGTPSQPHTLETELEAEADAAARAEVETQPPSSHEYWLLRLMFLNEELADWASRHLHPDWIQHPLVREIVVRRIREQKEGTWLSVGAFLDECQDSALQNLITRVATEQRPPPNPAQQLADIALRLRNLFLDRQLSALLHRASQPETSDEERVDSLRRQQNIRERKKEPLAEL